MKPGEVWEGWRNTLIPPKRLKEEIKRVGKERLSICRGCEFNSRNAIPGSLLEYCTKCHCPLRAKTKCLHCSCPLTPAKWGPIVDEKTSLNITDKISTNDE